MLLEQNTSDLLYTLHVLDTILMTFSNTWLYHIYKNILQRNSDVLGGRFLPCQDTFRFKKNNDPIIISIISIGIIITGLVNIRAVC